MINQFDSVIWIVQRCRCLWIVFLWGGLIASCAPKPPEAPPVPPNCHYTAVSRVKRASLPAKVYFFPPLLADTKGNPTQPLKPILSSKGELADWANPSDQSRLIQDRLKKQAVKAGFEVVPFQEVMTARRPHSILIISSFYTEPKAVVAARPSQPDQSQFSMIKASTFGLDLDPAKSRNLARVDGVSYFQADRKVEALESKSLEVLMNWLGDNVVGIAYLDP
jgi:hypothetical protein